MRTSPIALRVFNVDPNQMRTLWLSDGKSLPAHVIKVARDGIEITSEGKPGFIKATELCTADRVRFGFGTRKEEAWVTRLTANEAREKLSHQPTP